MKLHLFDNTPAKEGEKHGPLGPTHAGDVTVDYEYQAEMWVADINEDHPEIVRITCPDFDCGQGREWVRIGGAFTIVKKDNN